MSGPASSPRSASRDSRARNGARSGAVESIVSIVGCLSGGSTLISLQLSSRGRLGGLLPGNRAGPAEYTPGGKLVQESASTGGFWYAGCFWEGRTDVNVAPVKWHSEE